MVTSILYACSQPPAHPLRRVSLYYLGLAVIAAALAIWSPVVIELATRGPMPVPGLGGDVFESVGSSQVMANQFEASGRLLISLLAALLFMLPVSWVYMGTRSRVGFDQSVVQTMIILPIAVAGIVTLVHDSIALAFSLAGIVAAVRFRNTLKNTADALYIFAAIGVGLASGIGALAVAAVVSVFFNLVILLLWRCDYGVCPKAGPQPEFSSGLMFEKMRVLEDHADPSTAPPDSSPKKKKKHKKRAKKAAAALEASAQAAESVAPAEVDPAGGNGSSPTLEGGTLAENAS